MAVETASLSLGDFMEMPDRPGVDLELCDGEVVEVPLPSDHHVYLQEHITDLLRQVLAPAYHVRFEFPYGFPGEGHRADIAAVPMDRWQNRPKRRDLPPAAPELLIEILSPSNTTMELNRLRELCFRHGTLQFWEIDPDLKIVTVFESGHDPRVYRSGGAIPVFGVTVDVDQIFPD